MSREVGFAASYTFKYSPRPGTPGAELKNQIDEADKSRALADPATIARGSAAELQSRRRRADACRVLFEKLGRHAGQVIGRSPYLQSVVAAGEAALIGAIADVEIVDVGPNSLRGRIVTPASQIWRDPAERVFLANGHAFARRECSRLNADGVRR